MMVFLISERRTITTNHYGTPRYTISQIVANRSGTVAKNRVSLVFFCFLFDIFVTSMLKF